MEFGFLIKKFISALAMPMSIGFFIAFIGLFLLYKNRIKSAKYLLSFAFLWFAIISYNPVSSVFLKSLENSYSKLETIPQNVNYILLLGGDMENRAWEVLRLYHKIPNAKIITSGYAERGDTPEAIKTANIFYELGIPKENILVHNEPKDTKEEAIKMKELLGTQPFILVTSAYHMPRSIALFQKEGLTPIPAPSDFKIKYENNFFSLPNGNDLAKTEIAWHEYLGYLWSKLRGQI